MVKGGNPSSESVYIRCPSFSVGFRKDHLSVFKCYELSTV